MNKKTFIIIGSSILGLLVALILIVWLISVFKPHYYEYEELEEEMAKQEEEEQKKLEDQMKLFGNQPIVPQDPSKESQATAKNGGGKQSTAKNSSESQANVESKKDEKKDKKAKNNTNS